MSTLLLSTATVYTNSYMYNKFKVEIKVQMCILILGMQATILLDLTLTLNYFIVHD